MAGKFFQIFLFLNKINFWEKFSRESMMAMTFFIISMTMMAVLLFYFANFKLAEIAVKLVLSEIAVAYRAFVWSVVRHFVFDFWFVYPTEWPQPQVFLKFGLLNLKPEFWSELK